MALSAPYHLLTNKYYIIEIAVYIITECLMLLGLCFVEESFCGNNLISVDNMSTYLENGDVLVVSLSLNVD